MEEIQYYNRYSQQVELETVFGQNFLKWLYQSSSGKLLRPFFSSKYFSALYGNYKGNLGISQIKNFIDEYKIDPNEFVNEAGNSEIKGYKNFNQFFMRNFKNNIRPFDQHDHILPAFCEGRYLGFDSLKDVKSFPVKGEYLNLQSLIQRDYPEFKEGPILICRLAPMDYHHFHYPDDGQLMESYRIDGQLDSVTPYSLKAVGNVFIKNERQVSVFETKHFSSMLYIEVGALSVGKIIQTHNDYQFSRGEIKGHFKFGASTVIVVGQNNSFKICDDILEQTKLGRETFVKLGDRVGTKIKCL